MPNFEFNATEGTVYVTMYTADMKFVERQSVHIPEDIYSQWESDDSFIINYTLEQLGLELRDEV